MDRPLTILQFGSSSAWNGEAAHVASLCRSLAARGHHIVFAYRTRRKDKEVRLWADRLDQIQPHETIPLNLDSGFYPGQLYSDFSKLRARFDAEPKIDVIHAHRSQDHWLAGFLKTFLREKPALVRTRHVTTPWKPHVFDRWLFARTNLALSTCQRIDAMMQATELIPPERRAVLHGGVDDSRFQPGLSGGHIREELGIGADAFVAVAVGHLDPVKGYDVFIRAVANAKNEIPNLHGLIVGRAGKTTPEELKALAQSLGVQDCVHLLGERSDVPEIMAASDLAVITSIGSEGNSRVTLETMAMRVPLIATDIGSLPDLITHEETGLILKPGDAGQLATAILQMHQDREARERFAQRGYERLKSHYTESIVAETLEGLYRKCIGGSRKRRDGVGI